MNRRFTAAVAAALLAPALAACSSTTAATTGSPAAPPAAPPAVSPTQAAYLDGYSLDQQAMALTGKKPSPAPAANPSAFRFGVQLGCTALLDKLLKGTAPGALSALRADDHGQPKAWADGCADAAQGLPSTPSRAS